MRLRPRLLAVLASVVMMASFAVPALAVGPVTPFFNGFETDTAGWNDDFGGNGFLVRQPSGYIEPSGYATGVASASGAFHARLGFANCTQDLGGCIGPNTAWGNVFGTRTTFPTAGYTTGLAIYLDVAWATAHPGARFDWSSAIYGPPGQPYPNDDRLRYAFNAKAVSGGFVIGSSQDEVRSSSDPAIPCPTPGPETPPNTCRAPVTITTPGWYTFRHVFRDDGAGQLAVDLAILNNAGGIVPGANWTIFEAVALTSFEGPAFGWFANQEIPGLAIDDSRLVLGTPTVSLDSFRDVRRSPDIAVGLDVCASVVPSINMTRSAGASGDTWISVYDTTPLNAATHDTFGSVRMSADVVIRSRNNKKGAGLLALFNDGAAAQKGLALVILNSGNTDTLALGTVSKATGTFTVLTSVSLGNQIAECAWYNLTINVAASTTGVTLTGAVFRHTTASDPNSAVGLQVANPLIYNAALPAGILATGEVGVVGWATGAVEDSSVTNFKLNP